MSADWVSVCGVDAIEPGMAGTVPVDGADEIAIFHTSGGAFYALVNKCPHKGGPLSQGIVHGDSVSCPLHNWRISLLSGQALGEDKGCTPTIPLKIEAGQVWLDRAAILARAGA
ncbi:MAG: nitrite reductase small subunit NirD [Erythrobacter sp.]|uniref:nitrite reductase small subunit NirD n=1 Tax=Erythrobacter sp. TaxID=1042 RepID=UPI0025FA679F|nr:nitrite reductase small subunit NirD [Erythrobacter sp.]MCL9998462.1 nitrite reductase small subunit NirD [Erythrobacter sp.]